MRMLTYIYRAFIWIFIWTVSVIYILSSDYLIFFIFYLVIILYFELLYDTWSVSELSWWHSFQLSRQFCCEQQNKFHIAHLMQHSEYHNYSMNVYKQNNTSTTLLNYWERLRKLKLFSPSQQHPWSAITCRRARWICNINGVYRPDSNWTN